MTTVRPQQPWTRCFSKTSNEASTVASKAHKSPSQTSPKTEKQILVSHPINLQTWPIIMFSTWTVESTFSRINLWIRRKIHLGRMSMKKGVPSWKITTMTIETRLSSSLRMATRAKISDRHIPPSKERTWAVSNTRLSSSYNSETPKPRPPIQTKTPKLVFKSSPESRKR